MKILFLSDMHIPYCRVDLVKKAAEFNKTYKADLVLSSGDLFDNYALSKFVKNPRGDTSHFELLKSMPQVKEIRKYFPEMQILPGNHDTRVAKRIQEAGLSDLWLRDQLEIVGAPPTWKWTNKDHMLFDGVTYTHGFFGQPQKHCHFFNTPTAHGHLHARAEIQYFKREDHKLWNMAVGFLADKRALALSYGPVKYSTGIEAYGYVTNGEPHLRVF